MIIVLAPASMISCEKSIIHWGGGPSALAISEMGWDSAISMASRWPS